MATLNGQRNYRIEYVVINAAKAGNKSNGTKYVVGDTARSPQYFTQADMLKFTQDEGARLKRDYPGWALSAIYDEVDNVVWTADSEELVSTTAPVPKVPTPRWPTAKAFTRTFDKVVAEN